jgi:hypothetical protein
LAFLPVSERDSGIVKFTPVLLAHTCLDASGFGRSPELEDLKTPGSLLAWMSLSAKDSPGSTSTELGSGIADTIAAKHAVRNKANRIDAANLIFTEPPLKTTSPDQVLFIFFYATSPARKAC